MLQLLDLNLNNRQLEAVDTVDGPIMVSSCAGSGKTKVLTCRIANMIENYNINPENILNVTFTKKAALEMSDRLLQLVGKKNLEKLTIGTFHSIGYKILLQEKKLQHKGWGQYNLLKSPNKFINEIMKDLKIPEKFSSEMFWGSIQKNKSSLITPEHLLIDLIAGDSNEYIENLMKVYVEYEKRKDEKSYIDFPDMIYKFYYLMANDEEILKKYHNKFQYILVDECQDSNKGQYELIQLLSGKKKNIFLVGDDDQCLYAFRGSLPEQFINIKDDYPNMKEITLEENYRSLPHILEAANNIIKNNTTRIKKELKPFKQKTTEKIHYANLDNEDDEALYVSNTIKDLIKKGTQYKDISILYRSNSQSRALEDALITKSIPYFIENGISFYNREEVQDLISYLKVIHDSSDNKALLRIINKPSRFLGKVFIDNLENLSKKNKCSLFDAIDYLDNNYKNKNAIKFKKTILEIKRKKSNNVGEIIQSIILKFKYDQYLQNPNNEEDNNKLDNIYSLVHAGFKHDTTSKFLDYINKLTQNKKTSNTIKLMTIHKSKGLEFPVVFLVGMSEKILPSAYCLDDISIEEERRVAYVGVTRAEEKLYLSSIDSYQSKSKGVSRFIKEIGPILNNLSEEEIDKLLERETSKILEE